MKNLTYIVLFLAFAFAVLLTGCKGRSAAAGVKAYNIGEYDRAASILPRHIKKADNKYLKAEYAFMAAESMKNKGLYSKAVNQYKQAIKNNYPNPDAMLHLADCYAQLGRLDLAAETYELYLIRMKGDRLAQTRVQSVELARKNLEVLQPKREGTLPDTGYQIEPMKSFNSKFSDYCPAFVDADYEVVYFTSMRLAKRRQKLNRVTGQGNSTIYVSKLNGGDEWTEPETLGEPFNTKIDDGTPTFSGDGKTMYFTRCPYDDANSENSAEAYEVTRSGGRWGEPKRIIPGGDSTMMVAHPAVSPDGSTLYFVSDKSGGFGGKDIYVSKRVGDGWGEAENAGALINTKGDEMFPYVRDDGRLYFASNGHLGYGGLDIYCAQLTETGRYDVRNMGLPINSMGDDFGICFKGTREEGLLSSNRGNSKGIDNIYKFRLPDVQLTLQGALTDEAGNVIPEAFVRVIGSDGTNQKLRPTPEGAFGITLQKETEYILLCGAKGFQNQKLDLNTLGKVRSENIKLEVKLIKN